MKRKYITYEEGCKRYSISYTMIRGLVADAGIQEIKLGRYRLIDCDVFENYLKKFKVY